MKLQAFLNPTTKTVQVELTGVAAPTGFTKIGEFDHPDETYPDSNVIYHGVRDLLYTTKLASPPVTGVKYPNGIYNMQEISITTTNAAIKQELYWLVEPQQTVVFAVGSDLLLSGQVGGGKTPYTYKWQFAGGPADDFTDISGATALKFSKEKLAASDAGIYKLIVTDGNNITIESKSYVEVVPETPKSKLPAEPAALTSITATPSSLSLSVATDGTNGKTVAFAPVPADADLGTLSIKTAPASATATATIANGVLTVKPVAAGTTSVVVTNGTKDVTVNVTVAA
ncbi:hypothetical protein [Erwinia phage Kuerle]|nr:hypothetical protein [Erwinia phage Kuerle]